VKDRIGTVELRYLGLLAPDYGKEDEGGATCPNDAQQEPEQDLSDLKVSEKQKRGGVT